MISAEFHPELGKHIADYPPNYAYTARRVLAGVLLVILGIGFVLVGLNVFRLPIAKGLWESIAAHATGGIFAASGLFFAVDGIRSTGPRVQVYEGGFVAGRDVFPWDCIEAFFLLRAELDTPGIPVSLTEYTVRCDDGRQVRFTIGVCQAEILAATIQERINPRLLAKARAEFVGGKQVTFDDASIDAEGLRFADLASGRTKQVGWNELNGVEAGGPSIAVRKIGESTLARLAGADRIATCKVANPMVFLTLVAEVLAAHRPNV
jgi:hypothetical protein